MCTTAPAPRRPPPRCSPSSDVGRRVRKELPSGSTSRCARRSAGEHAAGRVTAIGCRRARSRCRSSRAPDRPPQRARQPLPAREVNLRLAWAADGPGRSVSPVHIGSAGGACSGRAGGRCRRARSPRRRRRSPGARANTPGGPQSRRRRGRRRVRRPDRGLGRHAAPGVRCSCSRRRTTSAGARATSRSGRRDLRARRHLRRPDPERVTSPSRRRWASRHSPTFAQGDNVYYADGDRMRYSDTGPLGTAPPDPLIIPDLAQTIPRLNEMARARSRSTRRGRPSARSKVGRADGSRPGCATTARLPGTRPPGTLGQPYDPHGRRHAGRRPSSETESPARPSRHQPDA